MTYLEALDILDDHALRLACEHSAKRDAYRRLAIRRAGGHAPEPEPPAPKPPAPRPGPQPPSLAARARTLGGAAVRWAAKGCPTVAPEEYERRRSTCLACDLYDAAKDRCLKCGCQLKTKPWMATEKCPEGKW